ncbi:glycosyltransferase family 4 protein, partial [Bacillus velezensis]|uniref:glycosyltransferase family 4 protein n=1 Tax=Bacillus velezensis TaxID=492670 RepID=UPI0011208E81
GPIGLTHVPAARLVIAGANPPPQLQEAVARSDRAELTGFVPSLEPWYAQASVFVAPLLSGAGVKFKTVDAMLRGVPVVATPVGAEGIGDQGLFLAVTEDPDAFARAVIAELQAPDAALSARAAGWADSVYGTSRFAARLREIYASLGRSG